MVPVKITGILETTPDGVRVVIESTGRPAWLPRAHATFFPGMVVIPEWLEKKLYAGKYQNKSRSL